MLLAGDIGGTKTVLALYERRGADLVETRSETSPSREHASFASVLSRFLEGAGNLALKCMAVGGVWVGGGIAPRLLPVLRGGSFRRGYADKGRFSELVLSIPVRVSLETRAPLLGAAHDARRL